MSDSPRLILQAEKTGNYEEKGESLLKVRILKTSVTQYKQVF